MSSAAAEDGKGDGEQEWGWKKKCRATSCIYTVTMRPATVWMLLLLHFLILTTAISIPTEDTPRHRGPRRGFSRTREQTPIHNSSQDVDSTAGEEVTSPPPTIMLLQQLSTLHTLEEQQLRRLETLEYRLTKLEVQLQEKSDSVRAELREVSRRVQQLDWQSSKMDAMLEVIKQDTSGLNQGQEHLRGILSGPDSRLSTLAETEIMSKVHMLTAGMHSMRGISGSINDRLLNFANNLTQLSNMTSHVVALSDKLVTKQNFKTALLDMKQNYPVPTFISSCPAAPSVAKEQLPADCHAVKQAGHNQSGVYKIRPPLATRSFFVYCDMDIKDGGWTVVQNRFEGTLDFYRGWEDYKQGFGNLGGEFWLGLDKIHQLTNYKITELLIELQDFTTFRTYAYYSAFAIGTEIEGYPIQLLGGYDGDAGDSLVYHAGMKFSTYDMDNDGWHDGNCAESHSGAWWYNGCDTSNLNGRYLGGELADGLEYQGMYWYDWHGPLYSLMRSRMSVRPGVHSHTLVNNTQTKKVLDTGKKPQGRGDGDKHNAPDHQNENVWSRQTDATIEDITTARN